MKKIFVLIVVLLTSGTFAVMAQEQAAPAGSATGDVKAVPHKSSDTLGLTTVKLEAKPCERNEIIGGMWKRIYFVQEPQGKLSRYSKAWKHQYLSLDGDYFYSRILSAQNITDEARIKRISVPDKRPGYEKKFILNSDEKSAEIIFMSGAKAQARMSCLIAVKPVKDIKIGDMVMQGYTANGSTLVYELFRRWF